MHIISLCFLLVYVYLRTVLVGNVQSAPLLVFVWAVVKVLNVFIFRTSWAVSKQKCG